MKKKLKYTLPERPEGAVRNFTEHNESKSRRSSVYTPKNIKYLQPNQIYVYSSNLKGTHEEGTAYKALHYFGSDIEHTVGLTGRSYGIPTKDWFMNKLPLANIQAYINQFVTYAKNHPKLEFLVTEIGCDSKGYMPEVIAELFKKPDYLPSNIILPESFGIDTSSKYQKTYLKEVTESQD